MKDISWSIKKIIDIFSKHQLKKIPIENEEIFDVEKHEAISSLEVKDKNKKGKIVEVIESGYKLGEKIIRYPKVIIGKWTKETIMKFLE